MSMIRSLSPDGDQDQGPAPPAPASQAGLTPGITIEDVRLLAQTMREFDLCELEIARATGEQLRLRRAASQDNAVAPAAPVPSHAPPVPAASAPPPAAAPAPPRPAEQEDLRHVTSPFVGTFYRAPGPEAANFVEQGQRVRKGQTLCIIEAMKLMNELEAEYECVIVECLAGNGRPVEYGERLFAVRPV